VFLDGGCGVVAVEIFVEGIFVFDEAGAGAVVAVDRE